MIFPLYDNLEQKVPKKVLTKKQQQDCVSKLSKIDENGKELVYALILAFYLRENKDENLEKLPFDGTIDLVSPKLQKVSWNFEIFPMKLKHIIYNFVEMNLKTIEEDTKRFQKCE